MNEPKPERPLQARLLAYVSRPEYRPVKPRVLIKKLGLAPEQRSELRLSIKRLIKQRALAYGPKHLVMFIGAAAANEKGERAAPDASGAPPTRRLSIPPSAARSQQPPASPPRSSPRPKARFEDDEEDLDDDEELLDEDLADGELADEEREDRELVDDESLDEDEEFAAEEFDAEDDDDAEEALTDAPDAAEDDDAADDDSAPSDAPLAGSLPRLKKSKREKKAERAGKKKSRVESNGEERKVVVGVFRRTVAGHGFVRPRDAKSQRDKSQDIFVAVEHSKDAASGDLVSVRVGGRAKFGDQRVRGEVLEVLERDTHRFVGVYRERGGDSFVQIDGNLFSQPISVGDPGAKRVNEGDKVVVEMVRFPSHYFEGEGVIVEVLGARGAPGVDTMSIIYEFDLPQEFPEDVLEAARQQAELFDPENLDGRRDLTADVIITIDPLDARDFDDAISLVRHENGHWVLSVHIADVTHFVPERSPLDREARERATSIYLPDRVIPMLPETISNHLASLQPDKLRYARTVEIEFNEDGVRVSSEVYRSAIKSRRRFTYEEVDEYLADPADWTEKLAPDVHSLLGRMHELAMLLRRRRLAAGAIELTLPEVKIDLDRAGAVVGAHVVQNTVSHQIIEEFMLAANEAVATWLHAEGRLFLRRVHEQPELRRLKAVTTFVRELGVECESLESRFEVKRVLAEVAGKPMERAVNFAILKSMQKAHYSPIEEGHYALHSRHYCHFTSPIRRYPDLTVHRLCDLLARGRRPHQHGDELASLGEHCSEREQRAERAERELVKVKLLTLLSQRIGQQFDAVITGVESFGIFAQGVELPAEGLIHVNALRDDYYDYDPSTHALVGRRAGNVLRLGDPIVVEIARVDVDRRELDLQLVKRQSRDKASQKPRDKTPSPKAKSKSKGKAAKKKGKSRRGRW